MDRDLLGHLPIVLAVARRGGFASAAAELGISPSAASHAVRQVEERLGAALFNRTTRSVALSEAGKALVDAASPALQDIAERFEQIRALKGRVSGLLRLNAPRVALPLIVTPAARAMAKRFPDLTLEVHADDALSDIVGAGFDAGVRLGGFIAEDMATARLTPPMQAIIVASPAYLGERGRPKTIGDLQGHNCIGFRLPRSGAIYRWDLTDAGRDIAIEIKGTIVINDPLYARDLALAGVGLAYIFEPLVRDDLAAGRLTRVLPDAAIEEPGLFLYFPRRAAVAPKLRAFIDVARQLARAKGAARAAKP
jgi:DNA-binding transcriptional LysR family regulator